MGYFRILYYISYIFNTICRVLKRLAYKKIFVILILLIILLVYFSNKSQAVYLGNYDYADPNYAMYNTYDSIIVDAVKRINNLNSSYDDIKNELFNHLKSNAITSYFYYGTLSNFNNGLGGTEMINGTTYNRGTIFIIVTLTDVSQFSSTPYIYDNYCGIDNIDCKKYTFFANSRNLVYRLQANTLQFVTSNTQFDIVMPSQLFMYNSEYLYNYLFYNYSAEQIEALYEINNNLDTITDDTVSQDTTDSTNDVLDDSKSVFDNSFTNDLTSYNNSFLQTIMAPINSLADGTTTKRISFTLPFVNYTYSLRGDAISSHIRDTAIYTYVQLFWWVVFSVPIFMLLRRILLWLGTGEFINKPSKFALYMSNFVSNNITPGMM